MSTQLVDDKNNNEVKMYQTIAQIAADPKVEKQAKKWICPGAHGKKLRYVEFDDVSNIKVSTQYQRDFSPAAIKEFSQLNRMLLVPGVIARRPTYLGEQGGDWCLDGQHKGVFFQLAEAKESGEVYPAMLLEHDDDATLEQCIKLEAELFHALNSKRRKLTKIDIIRAGVLFDDPEACWILTVMEALKLHCDRFGSLEDDALELKSFNQFYLMLTYDNSIGKGLQCHINGIKLWEEIFPENFVTGSTLRGCRYTYEFMNEVLNEGQRKEFYKFLTKRYRDTKQSTFMKGLPQDGNTPKWILKKFLFDYKDYCSIHNIPSRHCIGDATMEQACQISKKFCLDMMDN